MLNKKFRFCFPTDQSAGLKLLSAVHKKQRWSEKGSSNALPMMLPLKNREKKFLPAEKSPTFNIAILNPSFCCSFFACYQICMLKCKIPSFYKPAVSSHSLCHVMIVMSVSVSSSKKSIASPESNVSKNNHHSSLSLYDYLGTPISTVASIIASC